MSTWVGVGDVSVESMSAALRDVLVSRVRGYHGIALRCIRTALALVASRSTEHEVVGMYGKAHAHVGGMAMHSLNERVQHCVKSLRPKLEGVSVEAVGMW